MGVLVHGLPMAEERYVSGTFGWLSPFAIACGLGWCIGYALMGAGWLTYKSEPHIRDLGFRLLPRLLIVLLLFLAVVFWLALADQLTVMQRWVDDPGLIAFPAVDVIACAVMI